MKVAASVCVAAASVWDSSIVVVKFLEKQAALAAAAAAAAEGSVAAAGADDALQVAEDTSACRSPAEAAPGSDAAAAAAGGVGGGGGGGVFAATEVAQPPSAAGAAGGGGSPAEGPATAAGPAAADKAAAGEGFSLRALRCLDLSAGCGLVGESSEPGLWRRSSSSADNRDGQQALRSWVLVLAVWNLTLLKTRRFARIGQRDSSLGGARDGRGPQVDLLVFQSQTSGRFETQGFSNAIFCTQVS